MSDILRVTTPLINKNQAIAPKPGAEPLSNFNIQDTSRVIQTHNQSELQKQNNGMTNNGDAPILLLNLLKDPSVAVSYLKNIFMLEEIFKLLPANNKTVTAEIEQIFNELMVDADDVKQEMVRQEHQSTAFKGELFDFLRNMSTVHKDTPEVQIAIANLLKSINNLMAKDDIIDAVLNSLEYLKNNIAPTKDLTQKLNDLLTQFRSETPIENFGQLKEQTLQVLKEIESNFMFNPKMSKVLSIVVYNLSRYNSNIDFFHESSFLLRQLLTMDQRQEYVAALEKFSADLEHGLFPAKFLDREGALPTHSKVMESLVKLVGQQASDDGVLSTTNSAKIDQILYSLLSSPCNFTPLLHFIIPTFYEDIRAFAEIWINPNSDEKDMPSGAGTGKHFLLVIDVNTIGRFEAEIFIHDRDNVIDFHLFCPPGYTHQYEDVMKSLPKLLETTSYRLGETKLLTLERSRSLMDVFKSLPYKRVGVDVKV